jgi:Zn2+/Cd2+-exporting ATPase
MRSILVKLQNPLARRKALVLASGGSILAGLLLARVWGLSGWRDVLMIAAALIAGWDIAVRAISSLRNRHVSIELLVTIATGGALLIGEYWEAAAVTFLFILGAYLEARTLNQTRSVLQGLLDLAPTTALVLREGRQLEVLPAEVHFAETVLVKPGAKVPVDGEVIGGHSSIDESAMTGEAMPVEKSIGTQVFAGTVNQAGLLKVRATGIGADTTLARIIRRVEEAQDEKAPTQRFIERFAQYYTPFIIGLSIVVFLITRDIERALTLLVIGCPGALVISTPVSVVAGIGRAAKAGILIKGGEYLENAGKISALALDKTGTLTQGKPQVTDVIALVPEPAGELAAVRALEPWESETSEFIPNPGSTWTGAEAQVLHYAAIAEAGSEHPLGEAILAAADHNTAPEIPSSGDFESYTGLGVRAVYQGMEIVVGKPELMDRLDIPVSQEAERHLAALNREAKTSVLVAWDGMVIGVLGIADTLREESREMVAGLKKAGLEKIVILTGDDRLTAEAIGLQAGIDEIRAELMPEDKLEAIRELQAAGHVVAMVGDGINDAPALAAADIGIAMGAAGTDVAIETADIALMADDLLKLPEAIRLSKATLGNIRQNVIIALVTVAGLLLGVLFNQVHMAGGMLIHEASVLIVILNGMRLLRM